MGAPFVALEGGECLSEVGDIGCGGAAAALAFVCQCLVVAGVDGGIAVRAQKRASVHLGAAP